MTRVACAAAFFSASLVAAGARADQFPIDARIPLRAGAGYDGQLRAGGVSFLGGVEIDVARIARGAHLVLAADFEALQRVDVGSEDPSSLKIRVGAGLGVIARPTHGWALVVLEGGGMVLMPSPTDPGAMNAVGGGLATTAYFYPWYVGLDQPADDFTPSMGRAILSGVALFARGEVDFTDRGNGGELAVGVSLDFVRLLLAPIVSTLAHTK